MNSNRLNYTEMALVFFLAILVRYLFSFFSGVDNFAGPDAIRYIEQSDGILAGDYNLEAKLFITAPLFSYIFAGFKWIFHSNYVVALEAFQILLSGASAVFLMCTANVTFKNRMTSLLTGLAYCLYPVTLYYVHQFSQESIFQSLFIISIFYFSVYLNQGRLNSLLKFSLIFSLALLTKSIILLTLPFLMLSILIKFGFTKKNFGHITCCLFVVFLMTLPYGLYNKAVNGSYVVASSGQGGHFLTGHNDDFYVYVTNPPPRDSLEYRRLLHMDYKVFNDLELKIKGKDHKFQQEAYLKAGIEWSLNNPKKLFKLAWINFRNFITPGFNILHHPFSMWLLTFLISVPVFLFAYIEITRKVLFDFKSHLVVVSLFLGMLSVAMLFYAYNRYRVITIEPYYLMYACSLAVFLFDQKIKPLFVK